MGHVCFRVNYYLLRIIIISSIILPIKIAFNDDDSNTLLDIIFDVFLLTDMIFCFFTAYVDNTQLIVSNQKKIVLNYIKSWFLIDLISILPISYFSDSNVGLSKLTRVGKIPRLYRLLKLAKLMRMLRVMRGRNRELSNVTKFFLQKLNINSNIEKLLIFIVGFLVINHIIACLWYFVAKMEDFDPDSWTSRHNVYHLSTYEIYLTSLYWTLTTVTTVGYGDYVAKTLVEKIFCLCIMTFGVLTYSFTIGALSSIVNTLNEKNKVMNTKLQLLSNIKKEYGLSEEIYYKARKVIKYDTNRNQKNKMNFMNDLPIKLRIELSQEIQDILIQSLYFFKGHNQEFIAYVSPMLKPSRFMQNDFIHKIGDNLEQSKFIF